MANQKYDNFGMLLAQGRLDWRSAVINGLLWKGVTFDATDKTLSELVGTPGSLQVSAAPIPGRVLAADGSMLGWPVSFNRIGKEVDYQLLLVLDEGRGDPMLLAFYDENEAGDKLRLKNSGTLIVRPVAIQDPQPPVLGVWIKP